MALRNLLIILGSIAVVAGVTLAAVWLGRSKSVVAARGPPPTPPGVLVAARPLASGTLLRPTDLTWKDVAAGDIASDNIVRGVTSEAEFAGAVTRREFATGEPLKIGALVKAGDRAFLAAVLAPGNRAVSISVDAPQSVAGLVLPGDRVDVILTQSFGSEVSDPGRKSVGETVLRNIRVIAVDQWLNTVARPGTKDKPMGTTDSHIPGTVTLEVSASDAERVLVAIQLGKIQLAVRALEGAGAVVTQAQSTATPTWASDVSPALRWVGHALPTAGVPPNAPPGAPLLRARGTTAPTGPGSSIEVMHGSKTEVR